MASRSSTSLLLAVAALAASTATAFAPQRSGVTTPSRPLSSATRIFAEDADSKGADDAAASTTDPFEAYLMYEAGTSTDLAIREDLVGDGEIAKIGDVVTVKYEGRLFDTGRMFDAGTFSFKLGDGGVIPGWEKGLEGCRVGGKRSLRIPPALAYGENGAADAIPPNADLEFDCEVVGVASGPVAEFMAKAGLGMNLRTFAIAGFALTIILPRLGLMDKGFI